MEKENNDKIGFNKRLQKRCIKSIKRQKVPQLLNHKNHGDDPDIICAELKKLDQELTTRIQNAYDKSKQQHNTGGPQIYFEQIISCITGPHKYPSTTPISKPMLHYITWNPSNQQIA
eukprot:12759146-Ditylum_brightwellii.AAC.2